MTDSRIKSIGSAIATWLDANGLPGAAYALALPRDNPNIDDGLKVLVFPQTPDQRNGKLEKAPYAILVQRRFSKAGFEAGADLLIAAIDKVAKDIHVLPLTGAVVVKSLGFDPLYDTEDARDNLFTSILRVDTEDDGQ